MIPKQRVIVRYSSSGAPYRGLILWRRVAVLSLVFNVALIVWFLGWAK